MKYKVETYHSVYALQMKDIYIWLEENAKGEYQRQIIFGPNHRIIWYFEDREDAMAFKLVFG